MLPTTELGGHVVIVSRWTRGLAQLPQVFE